MIGKKTIQALDVSLERDLKQELRDQGHYLTGTLENSLKPVFGQESNSVVLEVEALDYINDLENFTPPDQIHLSESQFQKLKQWVRLRGMGNTEFEVSQIAAAIYSKWKAEGRPTEDSKAYSSNGRRTHAIETSYENNQAEYEGLIENGLSSELDDLINKTFDQTTF